MTRQEALTKGADTLSACSDSPHIDAQRLLLHVLGIDELSLLLAHSEEIITKTQEDTFLSLIAKRATGMPLAYILGYWDFYGRTFTITPDVLVPRPDTEALIQQAIPRITALSAELNRPLVIADVGTGSGIIAITLALELPRTVISRIIAVDISDKAIEVAKQNAQHFEVDGILEFRQGDLLAPVEGIKIDYIVSNPPYVPSSELINPDSVTTKGLSFEPQIALDGGKDGLRYLTPLMNAGIPYTLEGVNGDIIQG